MLRVVSYLKSYLKTVIDATRSTAVDTMSMQIVPVVYNYLWDVVFRYVNYAP